MCGWTGDGIVHTVKRKQRLLHEEGSPTSFIHLYTHLISRFLCCALHPASAAALPGICGSLKAGLHSLLSAPRHVDWIKAARRASGCCMARAVVAAVKIPSWRIWSRWGEALNDEEHVAMTATRYSMWLVCTMWLKLVLFVNRVHWQFCRLVHRR